MNEKKQQDDIQLDNFGRVEITFDSLIKQINGALSSTIEDDDFFTNYDCSNTGC